MPRDSAVVLDMIRAVRLACEFSAGLTKDPFVTDLKTQSAVLHLHVDIEDFVSPTIVQRLHDQADGMVFNVALSDIPETKTDLVSGSYELPASPAGSTVAVKIIDMLGEEVVVQWTEE